VKNSPLFRHPRRSKKLYKSPDEAYAYHSYVMTPIDKEFLNNLFTQGVAIHTCQSDMKARYYAMRIRCILYKRDKDIVKACKFALRGNDVVGWSLVHFPVRRLTQEMEQRARDMGLVTHQSDLRMEDIDGLKGRVARLLDEKGGEADVLEDEDAIKEYILKSLEETKEEE